MQEDLVVERHANAAFEAHRANGRMRDGRRFGSRPTPYSSPAIPGGKINTTDLDSRNVKTPRSYTQGYNAQAVVNEQQIVLAAEVTASSPDFGHLTPMVDALLTELEGIGVTETPGVVVADAGYWHEQQMDAVTKRRHPGPDPARCRRPQHTAPGVDRRPLRLDADRPCDRSRQGALPQTPSHGRTGVRADQTQPTHHLLPTPRPISSKIGMATDRHHAQPDETPQTPASPGLRRLRWSSPQSVYDTL